MPCVYFYALFQNIAFMVVDIIFKMMMILSSSSMFISSVHRFCRFHCYRGFQRSRMMMMPEGPEVRTTVDQIKSTLAINTKFKKYENDDKDILKSSSSWYLSRITILSGRYHEKDVPNLHELNNELPIALNTVNCKGKFIFFSLEKSYSLWSTLGLSGGWTVSPLHAKSYSQSDHIRLCLTFIRNSGDADRAGGTIKTQEISLLFYDQRNFGTFKISTDPQELDKKLDSLGHCWLSGPPTLQQFRSILAEKRTQAKPLAVLLMNQKKTAGVGNYLLSEILYSCRIYPWATCAQLSEEDIQELYFVTLSTVVKSYLSQTDSATREFFYQRFCDSWLQGTCYNGTVDDSDVAAGGSLWSGRDQMMDFIRQPFHFTVYMQSRCPRGYRIARAEGPHLRTVHWVKELQTKHAPPTSASDGETS